MRNLLSKFSLKTQTPVLIVNPPAEFAEGLAEFEAATEVHGVPDAGTKYGFALLFAKDAAELEKYAPAVLNSYEGDAVLWFAYPKKTSKKYNSDLSRDEGWRVLGNAGLEPVSQIAVDDDWSAVRFRAVGYIKKMIRPEGGMLSEAGRARAKKDKK
ncbi:MAG: hypothetical protein A2Y33_09365 [Spirochaetes bacterium GWF1_51_8]|nr:MAG: hypothetical protein A2Y33_09365 [Spirochaetes bacterium GWF1_51_8]